MSKQVLYIHFIIEGHGYQWVKVIPQSGSLGRSCFKKYPKCMYFLCNFLKGEFGHTFHVLL